MFFFITLGVCLVAVAITLNVGWVILNWRRLVPMLIGVPFFGLLIGGVILNTIFLVREVRRNERHDSFLNAVTHELKTPITSIRLYLETLQRLDVPAEKRQEFYSIMLADSDRLLATVEQVLKAGEVGQRQRGQVRIEVAFDDLVRDCVRTARLRHHLSEDAITCTIAAEDMTLFGNPDELSTAVLNLLDNAVKYSPAGTPVGVRLATDGDAWLMLTVSDQGIGISPAHVKRIFRRFYRVPHRNVLKVKGTGLGLFLVRSIARQHGGDVFAESPGEGRGTTFRMQLPRAIQKHARNPVEAHA